MEKKIKKILDSIKIVFNFLKCYKSIKRDFESELLVSRDEFNNGYYYNSYADDKENKKAERTFYFERLLFSDSVSLYYIYYYMQLFTNYVIGSIICIWVGHEIEVESCITPDHGSELYHCDRCGYSQNVRWY